MTSLRLVKSLFVVCYLYFTLRHHSLIFSKQLSTIYSLRLVNCKNFESIRALSNVWRSIISFLGRKFVVKMQQCSVGLCTSSRTLLSHRSGKKQSFGSLQRFRKALNQQELIKGMFSVVNWRSRSAWVSSRQRLNRFKNILFCRRYHF